MTNTATAADNRRGSCSLLLTLVIFILGLLIFLTGGLAYLFISGQIGFITPESSTDVSRNSYGEERCKYKGYGDQPPHIILLLADDLGFNDVSWNNPDVETPNLEELARNGVILNQNYMQGACTPSRSALLTGKYPFRTGDQHAVPFPGAPVCSSPKEKLLPQYLKDLGYSTHLLGKWHLGYCEWGCTPTYRGFDTFYGYYNGMIDHYNHKSFGGYDWRDGKWPDVSGNGTYANELVTARALQLVSEQDCDEPMFLFMSYPLPHYPVQTPPDAEFDNGNELKSYRNIYLSMVSSLDNDIGDLVAALKDRGLYENSVIIFSSDNGGQIGPSSNYPLRGEKASIFEGAVRVPGFVHSPLTTPTQPHTSEGLLHVTDWFTTIISLAGGRLQIPGVDGLDQSSMLLSGGPSIRTEFVYNKDTEPIAAFGAAGFRMGDYKLIIGYPGLYDGYEDTDMMTGFTHELDLLTGAPANQSSASQNPDVSYNFDFRAIGIYAARVANHTMLFNLKDDPSETHNLAAELPGKVAEMRARLAQLAPDLEVAPVDRDDFFSVPEGSAQLSNGIWSPLNYCKH